jgi:hypothetical protein
MPRQSLPPRAELRKRMPEPFSYTPKTNSPAKEASRLGALMATTARMRSSSLARPFLVPGISGEHREPTGRGVRMKMTYCSGKAYEREEVITYYERRGLYKQADISTAPEYSTHGAIYYPKGAPPACQNVPEPKRLPVVLTPGLPEENLPVRLARKFLIGIIRRDNLTQLQAYRGLVTIAKKAARKAKLHPHKDEGMTAEYAAAYVLAGFVSQNRKAADMKYFGRVVCLVMTDDLRTRTRQKRNYGIRPNQLITHSSSRQLTDTVLPVRSSRPFGHAPDADELSEENKFGGDPAVVELISSEGGKYEGEDGQG